MLGMISKAERLRKFTPCLEHQVFVGDTVRGALAVARQFSGRAQGARPALVNGSVGLLVARHGRLFLVLNLTVAHGKIVEINVVADPERLRQLDLAVLDD